MTTKLQSDLSRVRRDLASRSIYVFGMIYLRDHLKHAASNAHHEIFELLQNALKKRGQRIALAAPRGFGKSTVITLIYLLYCVVFKFERFIAITSDTSAQAIRLLELVRREIESNELLLMDFPELSGKRPTPWTQAEFESPNGVRLVALGRGQNMRGVRFGKDRPTLIVTDDAETRQNSESKEGREKIRGQYMQDILPGGAENANFIYLGTVVHPDCLLAELLDPGKHLLWIKKRYQVIMREAHRTDLWTEWSLIYNSRKDYCGKRGPEAAMQMYEENREEMDRGAELLWSERYRYIDLKIEYENDPVSFCSEYQNAPINPKTCLMDVDECHFWDKTWKNLTELRAAFPDRFDFFGACDLAVGDDATRGDFTATVVLARDRKEHTLYVVEVHAARDKADQTTDHILALHQKYKFKRFAIETNGFQVLGAKKVQETARQRGLHIPIDEYKNSGNKGVRIQRLQPLFKTGLIQLYHHPQLLDQIRYFPRAKHDDILDALEMAARAAEKLSQVRVSIVGGDRYDWVADYRRNFGWKI